jgi:hypothetical protein
MSAWLLAAAGWVHANGGGLRAEFFSSWWGTDNAPLKATVEFDLALLWSTSVDGKYRMFRVVLENAASAPAVAFSKDADAFEVTLHNGKVVKGILDVAAAMDPAAWDALPAGVRKSLAYPRELEANSARAIYVLVPIQEMVEGPKSFTYAIRSQANPLRIGQKPATRA